MQGKTLWNQTVLIPLITKAKADKNTKIKDKQNSDANEEYWKWSAIGFDNARSVSYKYLSGWGISLGKIISIKRHCANLIWEILLTLEMWNWTKMG